MNRLVVYVKVSKGDDSIEATVENPIDAIEFLSKVQRSIDLGNPLTTEEYHGRGVVKVKYGSTESEVQG